MDSHDEFGIPTIEFVQTLPRGTERDHLGESYDVDLEAHIRRIEATAGRRITATELLNQ